MKQTGQRLTASYYWPFQSHGSLAPSCAIADVKEAGTTVWSSTQDTYGLRNLIARQLDISREKVRVVYLDGSGSYGSNGAFDAAADAALISRAVGKPVRLQWMRHDEHGWDPKGPAQLLQLSGGLDNEGKILAWESVISGPSGPQWTETQLGPLSAGQPTGTPRPPAPPTTQNLDPPYAMAHLRVTSRLLSNTPIRLSNLRAPLKIGNVFAVESFADELAAAARMDAIAFRRQGLTDPRALAVIDRAAAMIRWQPRPSPAPEGRQGLALAGRGIAYMRYKLAASSPPPLTYSRACLCRVFAAVKTTLHLGQPRLHVPLRTSCACTTFRRYRSLVRGCPEKRTCCSHTVPSRSC